MTDQELALKGTLPEICKGVVSEEDWGAAIPEDRMAWLEQCHARKERTTMSTAMVKANDIQKKAQEIAALPNVPDIYKEAFDQEMWAAASVEERAVFIQWAIEQEQETTKGVLLDFTQIKMPASTANMFEIPGPDGELTGVKLFEAQVIAKQPARALWLPLDREPAKGTLPTCHSLDGERPEKDSQELQSKTTCAECKWDQWDTGKKGRGKGCRERLNLFIRMGDEEIPTLFSLPPTSLKPFSKYAHSVSKIRPKIIAGLGGITTVFALVKARSEDGTEYNAIECKIGRKLKAPEMMLGEAMRRAFEAQMLKRGIKVEEAADEPGSGVAPGSDVGAEVLDVQGERIEEGPVFDSADTREKVPF